MKKTLYSLIVMSLFTLGARGQGAEDPSGPRKPIIDNISAGGTVVGTTNMQALQVASDNDGDQNPGNSNNSVGSGQHMAGQVSGSQSGIPLDDKLRMYPIPASTELTIDLGFDATATVTVFNIIGRTVYNGTSETRSVKIDVSGFTPGTYFVKVECNGEVITRKIQVTRS